MMKRLLAILIFSSAFPGLMLSGTGVKVSGSLLSRIASTVTEHDSTASGNLIEKDSFRLAIVKPSSGVQFYKDGIVFLSLSKNEGKMLSTHISFGTIEAYYAVLKDSVLGKRTYFSPLSSFSYPCDGISFSSDFKTMYFTKLPKKGGKEKIYMAKYTSEGKVKGGWISGSNPLDFCLGNYTYSHPTLAADGKVLIFASDKEGSIGGMDLFITRKEGDIWATPQNLGKSINTTGNEFFPFLDSDNNLYFSSDGQPGLGGYDIFLCKFNGKVWNKPVNLSDQINSEKDDIAFTMNKTDGKTAFYTRREKSRKDEMQLLRVALNKEYSGTELLTLSAVFLDDSLLRKSFTASIRSTPREPLRNNTVYAEQKNVRTEKKASSAPVKTKGKPKEIAREIVSIKSVLLSTLPGIKIRREPKQGLKLIPFQQKPMPVALNQTQTPPEIKPNDNEVVYRIQVSSSNTPRTNFKFTANNITYDTYEYFYLKVYRYAIGEFRTFAEAVELQNAIRKGGISQVFVVAFKNNERSMDPGLFK